MATFFINQTVLVVSLRSAKVWPGSSLRSVEIGDTGTITWIFSHSQKSYTVESVLPDGGIKWLVDFSPEDLEAA